jgi:hypothetical protein
MGSELVRPRVADEERRLTSLRTLGVPHPSAKERAEVAAGEAVEVVCAEKLHGLEEGP